MLKLANRVLRSAGFEVRRCRVAAADRGILATIRPNNTPRGAVLISYVPDDVSKPEEEVSPAHTHFWECRYMAQCYANAGFLVDVVDFAAELKPERERGRDYREFSVTEIGTLDAGRSRGHGTLQLAPLIRVDALAKRTGKLTQCHRRTEAAQNKPALRLQAGRLRTIAVRPMVLPWRR